MKVYVCDACKESYKPFKSVNINGEEFEGSMLTIVSKGPEGKMVPKFKADLCENCMKEVFDFLKTDLLLPESFAMLRYFSKKDADESAI